MEKMSKMEGVNKIFDRGIFKIGPFLSSTSSNNVSGAQRLEKLIYFVEILNNWHIKFCNIQNSNFCINFCQTKKQNHSIVITGSFVSTLMLWLLSGALDCGVMPNCRSGTEPTPVTEIRGSAEPGLSIEPGWEFALRPTAEATNDGAVRCFLIAAAPGAVFWSFRSSRMNSERSESTSARPKNFVRVMF